MNSSEKYCLKLDNFQKNVVGSFADLREDTDFTDVTLACDEHQIEAHKVILFASSPFFQDILKKNKNPHPLIYMTGLKAKDLISIVDFIYHGEVNIYQEDLNNFLYLATEMELKGLVGFSSEEPTEENKQSTMFTKPHITDIEPTTYLSDQIEKYTNENSISEIEQNQRYQTVSEKVCEQIKSMVANIDGVWTCTVCGTGSKRKMAIKEHIETHIEGLSYPCEKCGKTYR